jgi:hypothetical protein
MVIETLPQLATLDDDQRETIALELLQSVRERQRLTPVAPEIVQMLEERRAEFLEHPEQTKSWVAVKADLLAKYHGG